MQSIFRLPWCSDHMVSKMCDQQGLEFGASPVVDIAALQPFKRKRKDSSEMVAPQHVPVNKKQRAEVDPAQFVAIAPAQLSSHSQPMLEARNAPAAYPPPGHISPSIAQENDIKPMTLNTAYVASQSQSMDLFPREDATMAEAKPTPENSVAQLSNLQQAIDNEFSMQILLKHNELRLIEQELAKCQVALEQLRRCEVCPYPGDEAPCASVSAGDGPALSPAPGMTQPSHPSPFGVTDGPYSRHYRQWLLHDQEFDPISQLVLSQAEANAQLAARSTRNNGIRKTGGKSFSISSRTGDSMPALPNYPAPVLKDKSAPLVLRRSTDGQLVKLICNDCQRGNFSSIQGFLNHCRIAHKVDYKSHDLAAIDCGRILDQDEVANLPTETQHAPVPKQNHSRVASAASTPAKNLVHPMNLTGQSLTAPPREKSAAASIRKAKAVKPRPLAPLTTSKSSPATFKPSSQMPHLSAQFAKYKLGGNLEQAIAAAKQKIEFGIEDLVSSPDTMDPESPLAPMAGSRTVAGINHSGHAGEPGAFAPPVSRKGHREPALMSRHRPSPLVPSPVATFLAHEHNEIPESPQDQLSNLSPNTADSNPGLVSDHEDDDHASGSEDDSPRSAQMAHSLGVRRECGTHEMDIDVAVDDDIDQHGVVIRRNSMLAAEARGMMPVDSPSRPLAKKDQ